MAVSQMSDSTVGTAGLPEQEGDPRALLWSLGFCFWNLELTCHTDVAFKNCFELTFCPETCKVPLLLLVLLLFYAGRPRRHCAFGPSTLQ